jgi:hypothetical protein
VLHFADAFLLFLSLTHSLTHLFSDLFSDCVRGVVLYPCCSLSSRRSASVSDSDSDNLVTLQAAVEGRLHD